MPVDHRSCRFNRRMVRAGVVARPGFPACERAAPADEHRALIGESGALVNEPGALVGEARGLGGQTRCPVGESSALVNDASAPGDASSGPTVAPAHCGRRMHGFIGRARCSGFGVCSRGGRGWCGAQGIGIVGEGGGAAVSRCTAHRSDGLTALHSARSLACFEWLVRVGSCESTSTAERTV